MENMQNRTEIEAIKLAVTSLSQNEVSINDTIKYSIELLLRNYAKTNNDIYLRQALNHLWASLELGIPYEMNMNVFDEVLRLCNLDKNFVFQMYYNVGKKFVLTKNRLKNVIGRWRRGMKEDLSFDEVVNDIYERIENNVVGKKVYISHQKDGTVFCMYELIIDGENNILRDLTRKRNYSFEVTNDKNSIGG